MCRYGDCISCIHSYCKYCWSESFFLPCWRENNQLTFYYFMYIHVYIYIVLLAYVYLVYITIVYMYLLHAFTISC